MALTDAEKDQLKRLARDSIRSRFDSTVIPGLKLNSDLLKENRGAFVTLKKNGQLRGCIGLVEGIRPLYEAVIEMAQAAAFEDPRFSPVREEEVDQLEIEISVMTPLKRIRDLNLIEVGKHGLVIKFGYNSGLLLPQVATEYGWDRDTFLQQTCLKAGLPPESYQDPETEIYTFSAEVF
jgi:AmmeMemoRadiSam system protein A